jgi:hypothetical protein
MTNLTMYDAVTPSNIPASAAYVAGYVGGLWPTYTTLLKQFPRATILSIAINSSENAECLDVETGDATIADIPAWVKRQLSDKVYRPVIYSSVANMGNVLSTLAANNISRQSVRLWSAHYSNGNHICGPSSCGQVRQDMDGTQWTDNANGKSLDQSSLDSNFFIATTVTAPTTTISTPATIQNGSTGLYVTRAQAILNHVFDQDIAIDGDFGPATETTVKAVQSNHGLTADGIIGVETWRLIYGI